MKLLPNNQIEIETGTERPRKHILKLKNILRITAAAIAPCFYLIYKKNEYTEVLLEISKDDALFILALLQNITPPQITVSNNNKEIILWPID